MRTFFVFCLFISFQLSAQKNSWELVFAPQLLNVKYEASPSTISVVGAPGFYTGVHYMRKINKPLSLLTGIEVAFQRTKLRCDCTKWPSENNGGVYQRDPALDNYTEWKQYLATVPLLLRAEMSQKKWRPFVQGGLLGVAEVYRTEESKLLFVSPTVNKGFLGATLGGRIGGGINIPVSSVMSITAGINAGATFFPLSVGASGNDKHRYQYFGVELGLRF